MMRLDLRTPGADRSPRQRPIRCALALIAVLALSACGFQLRGSADLGGPEAVRLGPVAGDDELHRNLQQALRAADVRIVTEQDAPLLQVSKARFERRVLAIGTDGKAREFALRYTVRFGLQRPNEEPRTEELTVLRNLTSDQTRVLGKIDESTLYRDEMRREAAWRIVSRLPHL